MTHSDEEGQQSLSESQLRQWTKKDLVKWLEDKRCKKSGNKPVLIHRILRAIQFDTSESECESEDSDSGDDVDLPDIGELTSSWSSLETQSCPPVSDNEVENYFIFHKNPLTGRAKNCNRQLKKAKKFAKEDYVHETEYNDIETNSPYCYVRAKCKPSMKETVIVGEGKLAKHYSLHVLIVKRTGKVISAFCNCKPGSSGVCSHVGGLLLVLVKVKSACTSHECTWLPPKTLKPLSPKRLKDIKFVNKLSEYDQPVKPYPDVYQAGPCKDPELFFKQIMNGLQQANPKSVLYQTFNPDSVDISDVLAKYDSHFMYTDQTNLNSTVCQSEFRKFVESIHLTPSEIKTVETATKGQSLNRKWREMRTVILTASNFGNICKKRPNTAPENLIKQLRGYECIPDTIPLRYGRKKETTARREYIQYHQRKCGNCVTVETTGLRIAEDFPFLGASADGIIKCTQCGTGALEIKCPYSGRNLNPADCHSLKNFCASLDENGNLSLKNGHNYMYQLMGQLKVLKLDWCDFVIWTKKGLSVERICFSEKFWQDNMLFKLKFFYSSVFVAELFSYRVKRGKQLL